MLRVALSKYCSSWVVDGRARARRRAGRMRRAQRKTGGGHHRRPSGAVFREETAATGENGHDHTSKCGYFLKGYDLDKADGLLERGIMITLHSMPDQDAAKRFYDQLFRMAGRSIESVPGASIAPAGGVGEAGDLQLMALDSTPPVQLANMGFFKGSDGLHAGSARTPSRWRRHKAQRSRSFPESP